MTGNSETNQMPDASERNDSIVEQCFVRCYSFDQIVQSNGVGALNCLKSMGRKLVFVPLSVLFLCAVFRMGLFPSFLYVSLGIFLRPTGSTLQ